MVKRPRLPEVVTFRSDLPVRYIDHMGSDLMIAQAAWEDWDREFDSLEHAESFFDKVISEHHGSPIEFSEIVFHTEIPLFTATQLLRHRTMNFAGRSARYRRMTGDVYIPPVERPTRNVASKMNPEFVHLDPEIREQADAVRRTNSQVCWDAYKLLLELGEAEEIARGELNERFYTGYSFKADLRNIFGFLQLRVDDPANLWPTHPQWEIQQVALQVQYHVSCIWPVAYQKFTQYGRIKP